VVRCYCPHLVRLSDNHFGDDVVRHPLTPKTRTRPLALGQRLASLLRHRRQGIRAVMRTKSPRTNQAEDICKSLEFAVLKYFPRSVEIDAFLFADDAEFAFAEALGT
jgi:hypothetical protein